MQHVAMQHNALQRRRGEERPSRARQDDRLGMNRYRQGLHACPRRASEVVGAFYCAHSRSIETASVRHILCCEPGPDAGMAGEAAQGGKKVGLA